MEVKKPIFIIGTGRSGSTIFHKIMSEHPDLAWSTKFNQWFPASPGLNRLLMSAIDVPLLGARLKSIFRPKENYRFWDHWCGNFSDPRRDLLAEDVSAGHMQVKDALSKILTARRNRLLMKITGWPRIGFLKAIFPDAKFIHIFRDGRSVAYSLLQQTWWKGTQGPEHWRWGPLSEEHRQLWQQYDKSLIVLAAIEWMILMDSFDKATTDLSSDTYKLIKYEDLCANVSGVMEEIIDFCELEWTDTFSHCVNQYVLRSANNKWKTELSEKQQHDLQEVLGPYLEKYGYVT